MSKNVEKTFEERLESLKRGCILLGILHAISFILSVSKLNTGESNLISVIISGALIVMLYFIYKYTKERNPLGPTLETVFGILLLIEGIVFCMTLVGAVLGLIAIILALGILDEAKYFKNQITPKQ